MFWVVLSLCVASCLAKPSIGYSYSAYAPLSHSYAPYQSLLTPYSLKAVSDPYVTPVVYNAPVNVIPHAPAAIKTQYHTEDLYGQTSYGHSEPEQSHHAVQDAHGNKVGSFSYVKPDGHVHRTDYVADAAGYRVASNDLPVGPSPVAPVVAAVPHSPVVVDVPTVPQETPEVIAAKAAHFAAHAQARAHSLYKRSIYPYAAPVVTPSGHLADTPEVAAAKAAHFAEHAKRGNYHLAPYAAAPSHYSAHAYYTPYAHSPAVVPSLYSVDTPEIAVAKAAHFAAKAHVSSHLNAIPVSHGAPYPYVTPDGHPLDTPEVAAAKAAHLSEHAATAARNAAIAATHSPHVYPTYAPYSASYHATPIVQPDGHLADTPEVAHAKAAHFAEYAAVASRHKRSLLWGQTPAHTVPLATHAVAPLHSYSFAHPYAYAQPLYAHTYSSYPTLKSVTHTAIAHGPHAVSYTHRV